MRHIWQKEVLKYSCPNKECALCNVKGAGNINYAGWINREKNIRRLSCSKCGKKFSSRKGSVFFGFKLDEKEIMNVVAYLLSGNTITATHRLTGVSKDTIMKIKKKFVEALVN